MNMLRRVLPQPILSLHVLALWIVLAPAFSLGQMLLGTLLGWLIPLLTNAFWPERPRLVRPFKASVLFVHVLGDIVVANWQVARLVLGPTARLRPTFVTVPLALDDVFVATVLGSIVSLTPGTVSIDIDCERWLLYVHALDVENEAALIATIKSRYEAPLKEIFQC